MASSEVGDPIPSPMRIASSPSSMRFGLPRSHLDSGTYRSLVRILSVCFDSSARDSNPSFDGGLVAGSEIVSAGSGGDGEVYEGLVRGNPGLDDASSEGLGHRENGSFDFFKEFEGDEFVDVEFPEEIVSDCAAGLMNLIEGPRGNGGDNPNLDESESEIRVFSVVNELKQEKKQEKHIKNESQEVCPDDGGDDDMVIERDRLFHLCPTQLRLDGEIKVNSGSYEPALVDNQLENCESAIRIGGEEDDGVEEGEILVDHHAAIEAEKLEENSVAFTISNCTERKIGSFTNSICEVDEPNMVIADRKGESLNSSAAEYVSSGLQKVQGDYFDSVAGDNLQSACIANLGLYGQASENLDTEDEENQSDLKVDEDCMKKKRRPLTEERKEKKKRAKKRKRAQKEREQGVKRLKLQLVAKPKPVKYCEFYLKGRCRKGDTCKFSHDASPLTKSQPCKYFACNTCLKGDDCPFDHELSKYPCHNFQSKGMCFRGDDCKFSHKMPSVEDASTTSTTCRSCSPVLKNQFNVKNHSRVPTDLLNCTASRSTFSIYENMKENLVEKCLKLSVPSVEGYPTKSVNSKSDTPVSNINMKNSSLVPAEIPKHTLPSSTKENLPEKYLKPSVRMPSGVRFLQFGKEPSLVTNKSPSCNTEEPSLIADKSLSSNDKKPLDSNITSSASVNGSCRKERPNNSFSSCHASKIELSDSSKILEEFLFGGCA